MDVVMNIVEVHLFGKEKLNDLNAGHQVWAITVGFCFAASCHQNAMLHATVTGVDATRAQKAHVTEIMAATPGSGSGTLNKAVV